jgi:hypothetical protein
MEPVLPLESIVIRLKDRPADDEGVFASNHGRPWIPLPRLRRVNEQRQLDFLARLDGRWEPRRRIEDGDPVPLSSGQITFLRYAALLCLYIENGTLVLLDEPETHLHPDLVTDLVYLLNSLLKQTGSLAIIATHSSYFVREAPSSQVIVLKEPARGEIEITQPRLKTLGADVGAISQFVFGDEWRSRLLADLGENLRGSPRQRKRLLARLAKVLPVEAMMFLRRTSRAPLK